MNPQDNALVAKRDELIQAMLALLRIEIGVEQRVALQTAIASYALGIVGACIASRRPPEFYDAYIRHIFAEVAKGRSRHSRSGRKSACEVHGDVFLRAFAEALMRADKEDLPSLRAPALDFIERYGLAQYLDNFAHGEKKLGVA
jgi:hypothetical protein